MKAGVSEKISTWIFYVLMAVSAVVLVLFYFVGYDNMTQVAAGMVKDPENLDILMYWMYLLLAVSIVCVVLFALLQFLATLKSDPKSALKGLLSLVLLVALFGGAYSLADDSTMIIAGSAFEDRPKLILTDVCIYVQYVLLAVTVLCTVVSLLGVFKASNKIKA